MDFSVLHNPVLLNPFSCTEPFQNRKYFKEPFFPGADFLKYSLGGEQYLKIL